jgi:hypothetical protein
MQEYHIQHSSAYAIVTTSISVNQKWSKTPSLNFPQILIHLLTLIGC